MNKCNIPPDLAKYPLMKTLHGTYIDDTPSNILKKAFQDMLKCINLAMEFDDATANFVKSFYVVLATHNNMLESNGINIGTILRCVGEYYYLNEILYLI